MDGSRFDALTRSLATGRTRRSVLGGLAAAALGSLGLARSAEAAKCRSAGNACAANADCCSGACEAHGRGKRVCACRSGADCPAPSVCNASACVAGACTSAFTPNVACGNGGVCHGSGCCTPESSSVTCAGGKCGSHTNNCGQSVACLALANAACANDNDCCSGVCVSGLCQAGPIATGGACDSNSDCATGHCCGSTCRDLTADLSNCGTCGNACPTTAHGSAVCQLGACSIQCTGGYSLCSGLCVDTTADPLNCGACAHVCPPQQNSAAVCAISACALECTPGYADCDGQIANGCEVHTVTDLKNCGACGVACSTNNVTNLACVTSVCSGGCAEGYANCDGDFGGNGCETNILTSNDHCGACGNHCATGETCVAGVCKCGANPACAWNEWCSGGSCLDVCPANSCLSGCLCIGGPDGSLCAGAVGQGCVACERNADCDPGHVCVGGLYITSGALTSSSESVCQLGHQRYCASWNYNNSCPDPNA